MKGIKKLFFQNLANVITVIGLISSIWFLLTVLSDPERLGLILILGGVSALTDFFDGPIARRLGIKSTLGCMLDQLRDRVFIYPALIILAWRYRWILENQAGLLITFTKALIIGILLLEVLLFISWCIGVSWYLKGTMKVDLAPNKLGKRKMFTGFTVVLIWLVSLATEKYLGLPLIKFSIFLIDLGLVLMVYWAYKSLEDYSKRTKIGNEKQ